MVIPMAHQTLAIQCFSTSASPKPVERPRAPFIMFCVDKYGEMKQANPGKFWLFVDKVFILSSSDPLADG